MGMLSLMLVLMLIFMFLLVFMLVLLWVFFRVVGYYDATINATIAPAHAQTFVVVP